MGTMEAISLGNAAIVALMGYAVVFFGLILLMAVIMVMGKMMTRSVQKEAEPVKAEEVKPESAVPAAPGSAGQLKLYDTDPKDAAMIMAIVADSLGKPINELRFISIREVKE